MANMSDYLEVALIDHVLRTSTFSKPTAVYVALFTAAPSDAGGGTEVTGGGYARLNLGAPADADWTRASSTTGIATNAADWSWTASGANYGTVTHLALMDASTSGNFLFHGALTASKTINDGDTFTISAGNCTITIS
jgi:hypothetical protein